MSEATDTSTPSSGTETLEPTGKPKKKNLLLAVVAIIVVVALVAVAFSGILGGKKDLAVTLSTGTATLAAGKSMQLTATVKYNGDELAEASVDKILWKITPDEGSPSSLATLDRYGAKLTVNLKAGKVPGNGTIDLTVTHQGVEVVKSIDLTVIPPSLDSVDVVPSGGLFYVGAVNYFSAVAVNSIGEEMTGASFEWSVSNLSAADYTLNRTTGDSVAFKGLVAGNANLTVKGTVGPAAKWGNATLELGPPPPSRAAYRWYDFFNVPFEPYWGVRWNVSHIEQPVTSSYPYIYKWHGSPVGNVYYYSDCRLNLTATNRTEINMNTRAEFLPYLGSQRGGNAVIDWHFDYLNHDVIAARFPPAIAAWDDGWMVELSGTTTLDKQAAKSVLGLTEEGYADFPTWWSANSGDISLAFQNYYKSEANGRLDIYPANEYTLTFMSFDLTAEKVGDKIVITQDSVSWGMELLMGRWLHDSFMPTEWYFYDGDLHMSIGPSFADINLDAAVIYSMYMYETTLVPEGASHGDPCWVFEALTQDYVASTKAHPNSTFDVYKPFQYQNTAPGSQWYGEMMPYDYTPTTWNLSANETLTFEWPAGDQLFIAQKFDSEGNAIIGETVNLTAPLKMEYSEPMDSDAADQYITPGTIVTDNENRIMTFTGPIDMYDWSRTQTNHTWLKSEWERMGILPYGAPYTEWKMGITVPPHLDHLAISAIDDLVVVNETKTVKVTAYDQYNHVYTGYNGTVNFTSNRTGALLPANYTFVEGDAGAHVFEVNFTAIGNYTLTCKDIDEPSVTTSKAIWVVPTAPAIDHFNMYISRELSPGCGSDLTVVAINQYGTVFTTYNGTVTFSTNATAGTYTLPANYVFKAADRGNKTFVGGVTFSDAGNYTLSVQDVYNTTATGSVSDIVVMVWPEITYKLYDMFEQPFKEWFWYTGQYGRITWYYQDYILFNETHKHAWLYAPNPDTSEATTIFAPYRWSIDARNVTTINVHHPEFTFVDGTSGPQADARVNMTFKMDYITYPEWENYWIPVWGWERPDKGWNETDYMEGWWAGQCDGYQLGILYNITMNREAALEWIGLPLGADVATWYNTPYAGGGIYPFEDDWNAWILNEANNRLDIYSGYDSLWCAGWNWMTVKEIQSTGDVVLTIAEVDWGTEVLLTRWLTEANLCLHEPYYEDLTMYVNYSDDMADMYLDSAAMYGMRAVAANQSTGNAGAWEWDPMKIDYVDSMAAGMYHHSYFDPYASLTYKSRNAGDALFGQQVGYDVTPWWFNLTAYQKLIIQLPTGNNVPGVLGQSVPSGSFHSAQLNMTARIPAYTALMYNGTMDLGFYETGGVDLRSMYNSATKTLTIQGPVNFDYPRDGTGLLYHGAPWIEFNVTPVAGSLATPVPAGTTTPTPTSAAASVGSGSLMAIVLVATISIAALGVAVRRHY